MQVLQKLFNYLQHKQLRPSLSEVISQEQLDIFFELANHQLITLVSKNKSHNHSFGDKQAQVNGVGHDYSQSREYVSGDEYKSINWRQSAKADALIVNQYHQENQYNDYILLDCRSNMFFATKGQPKLSLALKTAIYQTLTSILTKKTTHIIELKYDKSSTKIIDSYEHAYIYFSSLVNSLETTRRPSQLTLYTALEYIISLRPIGSHISVISDFNDHLQESFLCLNTLQNKNFVTAIRILDIIETSYPLLFPIKYCSTDDSHEQLVSNKYQAQLFKHEIENKYKLSKELIMSGSFRNKEVFTNHNDYQLIEVLT